MSFHESLTAGAGTRCMSLLIDSSVLCGRQFILLGLHVLFIVLHAHDLGLPSGWNP